MVTIRDALTKAAQPTSSSDDTKLAKAERREEKKSRRLRDSRLFALLSLAHMRLAGCRQSMLWGDCDNGIWACVLHSFQDISICHAAKSINLSGRSSAENAGDFPAHAAVFSEALFNEPMMSRIARWAKCFL